MINKAWLHCLQFEGFVKRIPFIFTVHLAHNFVSTMPPAKSIQISQFHYHRIRKLVRKARLALWLYTVKEKC